MGILTELLARRPIPSVDLHREKSSSTSICIRAGAFAALIRATDLLDHLCVDVYPYLDDGHARASAFGMDNGAKYPAFGADAPGRWRGLPAVSMVAVLIGAQAQPPLGRWDDLTPAEQVVVSLLDMAARADNSPHVVEFTSEQLRALVPADLAARLAGYRTEAD